LYRIILRIYKSLFTVNTTQKHSHPVQKSQRINASLEAMKRCSKTKGIKIKKFWGLDFGWFALNLVLLSSNLGFLTATNTFVVGGFIPVKRP